MKTNEDKAVVPLASWVDGAAKQSIFSFIQRVTTEGSPDFVPVSERIAVFDNDGTLWCEQPVIQLVHIMERWVEMAQQNPALREQQPWKAAVERDMTWFRTAITKHYGGDESDMPVIAKGVLSAFEGLTTEEFAERVDTFFRTQSHPKLNRLYRDCGYAPMVELLRFLEAYGFTNYIVSGGGRDFIRQIAGEIYGIPRERVVGTSTSIAFREQGDGGDLLMKAKLDVFDDGAMKPSRLWSRIGKRPIFAAGNSNGDIPMLQFANKAPRPAFRLLVLHDDAVREFDYVSGAEKSLALAKQYGWTVVSMKNDWKQVFAAQSSVTAIDILLEPDATMLMHAEANNQRLRSVFPKSFALDSAHRPHITLIQRFVRTMDLQKVYDAVGKVLANANVTRMKLEAYKYYYAAGGPTVGVPGICARPTSDLLKLQADLTAAVAPFTVETGPIGAFTAPHDDPATDAALIQYVSTFVPKMCGEHFNPHVSTGVAPKEYLDKMLAEPFASFTFSPAGAAIYQLGPFGTAAKKLMEWDCRSPGNKLVGETSPSLAVNLALPGKN